MCINSLKNNAVKIIFKININPFLKIPWRRKWQPILVLLPRKSYGQRSLVGYSPWGHKGLDTTE